jgi:hypothetical protein
LRKQSFSYDLLLVLLPIRSPRASLAAQQRAFNSFRWIYTGKRPRNPLNAQPLASRYALSQRRSPD